MGATSIGFHTNASGNSAIAIGNYTSASGSSSVAIGLQNTAEGSGSIAMGRNTTASGFAATAMGDTTNASGDRATAMGINTRADSYASVAFGRYNLSQGDRSYWIPTDDLFVVGNGLSSGTESNAFVVHKNGNVRAAGGVQSRGGFRTPPMGDLDMGEFTAGTSPAAPLDGPNPGLDAGLRYSGE